MKFIGTSLVIGAMVLYSACFQPSLMPAYGQTGSNVGNPSQASSASSERKGYTVKLADDVYMFVYGGTKSLFVVTSEGVVVTDPQSPLASTEYKQLIREITDKPVKYVIYSHRHADHISGGEVFSDTAVFIAHEAAQRHLRSIRRPEVIIPDIGFKDRLTLSLGKKRIEILFLGKSETDDNIFVFLPKEKILFGVDSVGNRSVLWGDMPDAYPREWITTLMKLEELDFDILALGHGKPGDKQSLLERREYLQDLFRAIEDILAKGLDWEIVKKDFRLPKYETWHNYEFHFPVNAERIFDLVMEEREEKGPE
jgi:glyoxylase-like metal-dependent hydrolase (beta-lactamase superfamily II)